MKRIYRAYCRAEVAVSALFFAAIVTLSFASALMRLFDMPLIWAEDIAKLLFSWTAFLGADIALRKSRLVGVDILTSKLPMRVRNSILLLVHVCLLALLGVCIVYGFQLVFSNWTRDFQTIPISYGLVTLSLPVCAILMSINCLIRMSRVIRHFQDPDYSLKTPEYEEDDKPIEDDAVEEAFR